MKDAWEEKGKKEENVLMNTQKEINKYVKEKDASAAKAILKTIIENIKTIDNYSLVNQTIVKNIKNDNNSLLFANLILDKKKSYTSYELKNNSFELNFFHAFSYLNLM